MSTPSRLRRLRAAILVPAALLLSACGAQMSFTIHENNTYDYSMIMWDDTNSGTISESNCNEQSMGGAPSSLPEGVTPTYTFTSHKGSPACEMKATNIPIADDAQGITHENGKYTFFLPQSTLKKSSSTSDMPTDVIPIELSVTFPGEVSEVSGNGTKDGNTATWSSLFKETEDIKAVGADTGGSSSMLWIIVGIAAIVVVAVIAVIAIVASRKKMRPAGGAPAYATGQQAVPGQAGYQAPGQGGYQGGYQAPGQAGYQAGYQAPGQAGYQQPPNQPGY